MIIGANDWKEAKAPDSSGNGQRNKPLVRCRTADGHEVGGRIDVVVDGPDQGEQIVGTIAYNGTWSAVRYTRDGFVKGMTQGHRSYGDASRALR